MDTQTTFVYTPGYLAYELSTDHPFSPLRWQLTWDLVTALGLLDKVRVVVPEAAENPDLLRVHTSQYVDLVAYVGRELAEKGRCTHLQGALMHHGLVIDTPAFPGMHEASSLLVGGTLEAGRRVVSGEAKHAVNIAGGLHHAMPGQASGFCIYNDVAVLIAYLRSLGLRVAYADLDAHHGDGVQYVFYEDPGVLTFSVHEDGRYLFPGSGFAEECGLGKAAGTKHNVPLLPMAGDAEFLGAVENGLPEALDEFKPDILVTQHGCDGHVNDPLTHLRCTMRSFLRLPTMMHDYAHKYAGGNWVAVGGGGYDAWRVVPRAWAAVCATAAHEPVGPDTPLPEAFLEEWQDRSPVRLPLTFGEEAEQ